MSAEDARAVAGELLAAIHAVQAAASIGVALFDARTGSADAALRRADVAVYEAKRAGRGRVSVQTV